MRFLFFVFRRDLYSQVLIEKQKLRVVQVSDVADRFLFYNLIAKLVVE